MTEPQVMGWGKLLGILVLTGLLTGLILGLLSHLLGRPLGVGSGVGVAVGSVGALLITHRRHALAVRSAAARASAPQSGPSPPG